MAIDYKYFGLQLKFHRKQMGYTQEQVYRLTGISADTLRILEKGNREPRIITLERLSELYKIDLIQLLAYSRSELDFFSEKYLDRMNTYLNNFDYKGYLDHLNQLVDAIKKEYLKDGHKTPQNMLFINSLERFKSIDLYQMNFSIQHTAFLERVLHELSKSNKDYLTDKNLYYLEVQIGMLLSVIYRQNNTFPKSEDILLRIKNCLDNNLLFTSRQNDYLVVSYINLCYLYSRMDEYEKVLVTVNEIFSRKDLRIKKSHYIDLLNRKAVALYYLKNEDYIHIFTTVLLMCNESEAALEYDTLVSKFHLKPETFMDITQVAGFENFYN